jgi:flagellar basal-body rod modification protein FlgD
MIDSNNAYLATDKPLQGSVNLIDSVKNLTIIISDSNGREIRRLTLGDQTAGNVNFSWDGKDSRGNQSVAGIYQVKAEGTVNGNLQSFDTQLQATVQSISLGQGGQSMILNLVGLGEIDISKLREVL